MTSAPKPEVLYLPAIFRGIRTGTIRIPAFQRGYVWRPDQIYSLLDSVRKSYPIGSLLFWRVNIEAMQTDKSGDLPIPHPDVDGIVDFVLDGMQRISSLYGAFHRRDGGNERKNDFFAVAYHLANRTFISLNDATEECINLRNLFDPRSLLTEQARLGALPGGDRLVDESLELQHAFQEYLVPVVGIGEVNPRKVVEIFERVNSTGTRLGAVDFMRALTWSQSFDLTTQLQMLGQTESLAGFEVPPETLAKCVALATGIVPKSDEMIRLRDKPAKELLDAVDETSRALEAVGTFLTGTLGLGSYDFIPYEGQFLVLVSAASGVGADKPVPEWLVQWYWRSGFSEFFFGRTDQTISGDATAVRTNPYTPMELPFSLTVEKLQHRIMRKGAALAMTVLAALATAPAHSVVTGRELGAQEFIDGFDRRYLGVVFSRDELLTAISSAPASDKLVCNVVLLGVEDRAHRWLPEDMRRAVLKLGESTPGREALLSQCIDDACLEAIQNEDCASFLEARARAIIERARLLSGVKVQPGVKAQPLVRPNRSSATARDVSALVRSGENSKVSESLEYHDGLDAPSWLDSPGFATTCRKAYHDAYTQVRLSERWQLVLDVVTSYGSELFLRFNAVFRDGDLPADCKGGSGPNGLLKDFGATTLERFSTQEREVIRWLSFRRVVLGAVHCYSEIASRQIDALLVLFLNYVHPDSRTPEFMAMQGWRQHVVRLRPWLTKIGFRPSDLAEGAESGPNLGFHERKWLSLLETGESLPSWWHELAESDA